MKKLWSDDAWNEYLYWLSNNIKYVDKINALLKSIERDGVMKGLGKPEALRHTRGFSRRISEEDRLAYDVVDGVIQIYSCKGHYEL